MAGFWHKFVDPRVSDHLIADEGEIVVDEVRRHPMAFVPPVAVMILGVAVMLVAFVLPVQIALLPIVVGLILLVLGGYRMLSAHMDRFVITNMRVFRVRGIFSQHTATMPMSRILDISVHKPLIGRIFSYGHFVFESAAQDQGLRDIRYVARPDERDLTIQRVIQRSGLRSSMRPLTEHDDDHGIDQDDHSKDDHDGNSRRRVRRNDRGERIGQGQERAGGAESDVDFDLIAVDEDPTDGGSSRAATPEENAAWLAGRSTAGPVVDPVHGRPIPAGDVFDRDAEPAGQDGDAEHWTAAWSVRDRDEHRRARQQVAESELVGRDLRDWLPGAARVTLAEDDEKSGAPQSPRGNRDSRAATSRSRPEPLSRDERESNDQDVDDLPDNRS